MILNFELCFLRTFFKFERVLNSNLSLARIAGGFKFKTNFAILCALCERGFISNLNWR